MRDLVVVLTLVPIGTWAYLKGHRFASTDALYHVCGHLQIQKGNSDEQNRGAILMKWSERKSPARTTTPTPRTDPAAAGDKVPRTQHESGQSSKFNLDRTP